jgi:hypothetical protein
LVQVLVDSMEFTSDELESAVHSIPTPSGRTCDSGTSLREAIEVHMRQYMKVVKNISYLKAPTKRYRIRYRMLYHMRYRMRLQQTPCLERVPSDLAVLWLQVEYVNRLIHSAKRGDCLFWVQEVEDPSDKLIEVHLAVL